MCSEDRAARRAPNGARRAAVVVLLLGLLWAPAGAKVFLTQEEALAIAFPGGAKVDRRTAYLTEAQAEAVKEASGRKVPTRVVTWYVSGNRSAWFDTHIVRTLPETIMIVVDADGAIERIDLLSFSEPEDYIPPRPWYGQLTGRRLDHDLSLRRAIRPVTGATLSGRAVIEAARRILALHRVLSSPAPADSEPETPEP